MATPDTTAAVTAQHLERYLSLAGEDFIDSVSILRPNQSDRLVAFINHRTDQNVGTGNFGETPENEPKFVQSGRTIISDLDLRPVQASASSELQRGFNYHSEVSIVIFLDDSMIAKLDAAAQKHLKAGEQLPDLQDFTKLSSKVAELVTKEKVENRLAELTTLAKRDPASFLAKFGETQSPARG